MLHLEAEMPSEPGSGEVQSAVSQTDRQASPVLHEAGGQAEC